MSKPNDGGPAFPFSVRFEGEERLTASGMSLRDWFAGMALQGIMASYSNQENVNTPAASAKEAWERADAMLKARESS